MKAVVIAHEEHEGAGWLAPALAQAGFELTHRFRAVQPADVGADLVVVLGGTMSAFDTVAHPFLAQELSLLAARLRCDAPCLGVCLGAQLLARAGGAEVFRGRNGLEVGAGAVHWTEAGRADAVTGEARPSMMAAHWHHDTFSAVPAATRLASSDRYHEQAFRVGRSYGFQFHIELSTQAFEQWLQDGRAELLAAGCDVSALSAGVAALQASERQRAALVTRLAAHFGRVCRRLD